MAKKFMEHLQSPAPQIDQEFDIVEETEYQEENDIHDPEDDLYHDGTERVQTHNPRAAKLARLQIGHRPAFPFCED